MENLEGYSPIELQKMGNDIKEKHDSLKKEIIDHTYEMEELEKLVNDKVRILEELEKNYVNVIEKLVE